MSLSIKSSAEMVYTTLALAHATALLTALAEWRSLHEHAETSAIAAMLNANADAVNTNVVNALGIDAAMELDYGDRM